MSVYSHVRSRLEVVTMYDEKESDAVEKARAVYFQLQ